MQHKQDKAQSSADNYKVTMYAGKGGVGKTTCAAATALHYSLNGKRTLLISTDPTPSLCHIFKVARSREIIEITPKLFIDEIGIDRVKQMWDSRFGQEVYEVFSSLVDIDYDSFVDFMSSVLPGLRDEFMVDYIREIVEIEEFESVVWDTAPLGQTLGLLGTPAMLRKHLKGAPKIYSKLKLGNASKKPILDILGDWEKLSARDMEFLKNRVDFSVVTIPEALAFEQLDEIFGEFHNSGLNIERLLVNNIITDTGTRFLAEKSEQQRRYIDLIRGKFTGLRIIEIPMLSYEVRGVDGLKQFAGYIYG
jgi:arsenite-transporting ATPase